MRKQCLRILIAVFSVAGSAIATRAQVQDQLVVTIPFEFVAAGKTLPAGTYNVNRVSDNDPVLILQSFEKRTGVILLPSQVEGGSTDKVQVSFERVGGRYLLSKIATAKNIFTIPVPPSSTKEVLAHNSLSDSSSSGGK